VLQLSNVLKRPCIQHGVCPIPSSDRKQSQGISRQRIEFVVITDTELGGWPTAKEAARAAKETN
jgi:hypothetical protein